MNRKHQPLNTQLAQNVTPNAVCSIVLSGGANDPYYYSLGNQSTVPFVRLQGSGTTQKEFTWGETIEVFPGENVQVQNASYMAGDIQIQSGRDIANKPARITTPVEVSPFTDGAYGNDIIVRPKYPCDTRRAVRAFLGLSLKTGNNVASLPELTIVGYNQQHSWPGGVPDIITSASDPPNISPGKKYLESYPIIPLTVYSFVPLGFQGLFGATINPELPMILLDYVWWQIDTRDAVLTSSDLRSLFFYVLEY